MKEIFRMWFDLEAHNRTIELFIVNLFGGLLPLIFGIFLALAFGQWQGWQIYIDNGEFYLYSAGFATQAVYTLWSLKRKKTDYLFWFSSLVVIIASILYSALATSIKLFPDYQIRFNADFLRTSSLIAFLCSLFSFYFSSYRDCKLYDPSQAERQGIDDITNKLKP